MGLESRVLGWVDSELPDVVDMVGKGGEVATWHGVVRRIAGWAGDESDFVEVGVIST